MTNNTPNYKDCFSLLSEFSRDLVICLDKDFFITEINRAAAHFYQCNTEDALKSYYFIFCAARHKKPAFSKLDLNIHPENYPLFISADFNNNDYCMTWEIHLLLDKEKQTIGYLMLGKKVPRKYSFVEKYAENSAFLNNVLRQLPGNIYLKDTKGVYIASNDLNAQSAGFKNASELLGKTDYDAIWKEEADTFRRNDDYVISQKLPVIIEEHGMIRSRNSNTSNTMTTMITTKVPLRDEHNEVIGLMGVSVDISSYEQQIAKLERVGAYLKNDTTAFYLDNLMSHLPDHIYWCDRHGVYRDCNNQQANSFGLSKERFIGKTIYELAELVKWDKKLAHEIHYNDQQVMETGKTLIKEEEVVWTDGKKRIYLSRKVPTQDAKGRCTGLLGISTDITFLKEVERELRIAKETAEAENRAKTEFVANMSHDVKTPLSGIIALSQLLSNHVQEEYRQFTQDIFQAGQQLMILFENCIELLKSENKAVGVPEEKFNLRHLLQEIFNLFQPTVKSKKLELYVKYDKQMPKWFLGGRIMIYRILLNLLGNAIKFTSEGSITISAKLSRKTLKGKKMVELTVADTGIGIPHDKQKLIFERFSRLTLSYEGMYEGHGIGLYIVQTFVKRLHGQIIVKSKEGEGSRFIIRLPLEVLSDDDCQDETEIPRKNSTYFNSGLKISKHALTIRSDWPPFVVGKNRIKVLLVEDSLIAQRGSIMLLESLGCEVSLAQCGEEAINLFKPGYYALVLMDIGLPRMKGYDVAKRLREMETSTTFRVPILGLSAHATELEEQQCDAADMDEMLSKPLLEEGARRILSEYVVGKEISLLSRLFLVEEGLRIIDLPNLPISSTKKEQSDWKVLGMLAESLPESISEIQTAYQAGDKKLLKEKVHKLHGDVSYTRTPHLLHTIKALETCLKNDDAESPGSLGTLYAAFLTAVQRFTEVYQSLSP